MKKKYFILIIVLSFLLTFVLTGCDFLSNKTEQTIQTVNTNGELTAYRGVERQNKLTCVNSINMNNEYFFYYFYLGTVTDVPIYTSVSMQYQYDTEVTFSFNKLTSESLSNSISKATSTIDTHSYTGGFNIGFENEVSVNALSLLSKAKSTIETDHHWTNNWGNTTTDSETATSMYLTQYSNGYTEKVAFSEKAGFTKGNYYRMAFYNVVRAYGVLAYDVKNNTYSTINDFFLVNDSTTRVWEESLSSVFTYEKRKDLSFDVNEAIEYAEKHNSELITSGGEDITLSPSTYYVSTKPLSCKLNNRYNYDQPDPNANNIHFSHNFNFGSFVIKGCVKSNSFNDAYLLVSDANAELSFRLEYDANNLPIQDNMTSRSINADEIQSNFYNLPWNVGERNVGKGMIVILIEYKDGSPSDKICITDAFNNKKGGEEISITKNITKPCKVSIAICYELVQWAPGFLGISDDYWTNWRINQTFYFA